MKPRVHEWAWGDVGRRTVCGQTQRLVFVVLDLGNVVKDERCKNCERMRAAIGTSKELQGAAP